MPRKPSSAGRHGALDEARSLVALVASLSESGDALSAEAVSSRLGVTAERAQTLIDLVCTAHTSAETPLPLVADEAAGEISLDLVPESLRGRRLRLTRGETLALLAALERLGVAADDPLRTRLESSLSESAPDRALVERLLAPDSAGEKDHLSSTLVACARARVHREALSFRYRKASDAHAREEERHVAPSALRHEDAAWYLDGFDLDRQGERTFRVDRMANVRPIGPPSRHGAARPPEGDSAADARHVTLTFSDPRYLDLLDWHELDVEPHADRDPVRATTPHYGGPWLARMVAACGGTVTTDDPALDAEVARYARQLLRSCEERHISM